MLPGKSLTPEDIFEVLLRRRWLLLVPFALGLASAPITSKFAPKVYRSETVIMVIPQRVPDSYVRSTVTATVEDRLLSISDQILSRSRLERIITDFDLYKEMRQKAPMEDVVARMRQDVGPVQIQPRQPTFRVSYVSPDPLTAQKVASRVATLFIEENSREREKLAEGTNVFLESQLEEAKQKLVENEKKLEQFRLQHTGELPSQLAGNLQAMSSLQLQLQGVDDAQSRARERRLFLERQLHDVENQPTAVSLPTPVMAAEAPLSGSLVQQLEQLEGRLDGLRLRYTVDHPDVRAVERTIREVKAKIEEEESKRPVRSPQERPEPKQTPLEQAKRARIKELQTDIETIDRQMASSQADETRLRSALEDYQAKVNAVPTRESELVELTRDYEVLKKTYDGLVTKREDSKLAANLERRQIGEQFRILDPASLPERPDNLRNRLLFTFSGAIAGLTLGLCLVGFVEYKDSSFTREDEVLRLLTLPVLALVPVMASEKENRRQRRKQWLIDAVAVVVLVASIGQVVVWGLTQF